MKRNINQTIPYSRQTITKKDIAEVNKRKQIYIVKQIMNFFQRRK